MIAIHRTYISIHCLNQLHDEYAKHMMNQNINPSMPQNASQMNAYLVNSEYVHQKKCDNASMPKYYTYCHVNNDLFLTQLCKKIAPYATHLIRKRRYERSCIVLSMPFLTHISPIQGIKQRWMQMDPGSISLTYADIQ